VLNVLTYSAKPLFVYGWSALFLESFLRDLALNLLTFSAKPLFVHGWSAFFLESFLFDLNAKFADFFC